MSIVCDTTQLISEISSEIHSFDDIFVKDSENRSKLFQILNAGHKIQSPDYHIFVSTVASNIITRTREEVDSGILRATLNALLLGLAAIESETISLSGSCIIKLIQWDHTGEVSRILRDNADFVAILVADLCAMFSKIEDSGSAPFIRIVRFCELLIDVSGFESGLPEKIIASLHSEFISRILRTTILSSKNPDSILRWCNELLKACHRGNEFVVPILNEVFSRITIEKIGENEDFIDIIGNERSRRIGNLVKLIFVSKEGTEEEINPTCLNESHFEVTDDIYRAVLIKTLQSFENYKIPPNTVDTSRINAAILKIMERNRKVLFNWLPYCLKMIITPAKENDVELRMMRDISEKIADYLNL